MKSHKYQFIGILLTEAMSSMANGVELSNITAHRFMK